MKKKTINISNKIMAFLLMGAILFSTDSCKKYLSPEPLSTIDPSVAFGNIPNAKATVMGAYLSMSGDYAYGIRVSYYYAYDDDCIMGGGAGLNQARHEEAHYTLTSSNTDIVNTFNQFYSGIERANNCIYYIPKMPQYTNGSTSDKAELQRLLLGESLVIRSQLYFELIRIWGDVPAQWIPSALASNLFVKRTNKDTIYAHILHDLDTAKVLLPWRTAVAQDERFTKGTAMALRAKVALFAGGYSLRSDGTISRLSNYLDFYKITKQECDTLIAHREQHTLYPSYKGFWKDIIDAHKAIDPNGELIMQVAMANGTNSDSKIGAQCGTKINGVGGSLGVMLPIYFYQFDSTDIRRDVTVVPFEVVRDIYGRGHASNGIYDGKFRRDWITNPSYYMSNGNTSPITTGFPPVTLTSASNSSIQNFELNWPLIRFSDVLLMDAEVDNEINGAPSANAISYVKEVSLRGHNGNAALVPTIPTDHDGFFKFIVRERHLEFGGEGIRKFDLIRWNLLGKALSESKANLTKFAAGTAMVAPTYMAPPPAYCLTATLPKYMWCYTNMQAENGVATQAGSQIWYNSFYNPAPTTTPTDPTYNNVSMSTSYNRFTWFGASNITTTFVNYYAYGFVSGKSELYPIPQASLDANPNLKPNNPGY